MFHINTLSEGRVINAEAAPTSELACERRQQLDLEMREDNRRLVAINNDEHRRMVEDGFDTSDRIVPLHPFQFTYTFTVTPCTNGAACNTCHP